MKRIPRLVRRLHVQLLLWAVLPVTFLVIAFAFTGVYAHQRAMRDFVSERNFSLVRMVAHMVADGIGHGIVAADGEGLSLWMSQVAADRPRAVTLVVVGEDGEVLARFDADGGDTGAVAGIEIALEERHGARIVPGELGDRLLVTFTRVEGVGWSVIAWEPVEDLIEPMLRLSGLTPAVAAGAAVLSLLILGSGWFTLVRPLQQLAEAAEEVSWGDFSAISGAVGGVQEIQDLQQALVDMAERIQGYEAGMRDQLAAMTQGQEAERARLARELHDGPVQDLIALGQRAEMAQHLVERGREEEAQALLKELRDAEMATVEELRRLIGALRPSYLEDLGFIPALEMLVREVRQEAAAAVSLETVCGKRRLPPDVELAAYRITQEALTNALQHAEAEHITVRVLCDREGLTLSIADDGVGFVLPSRPDLLTKARHFGLLGMRERTVRLGGSFRVQTAPGEGTRVVVHLPAKSPTG